MDDDIEFDIDQDKITERSNAYLSKVLFGGSHTSFMVNALKKTKLAKSDEQAYYILLIIAIIIFLISIALIVYVTLQSVQNNNVSENFSPWLQHQLENERNKS